MSTNANLPDGAFITSINGKRCTAVPRTNSSQQQTSAAATTSTTEAAQETTTTTSEQDQQQQTTTSQQVESTSTSSTTTSSSSTSTSTSTTTSPESTTQTAAPPPPAQTSADPAPTTTRINSSPSPELAQESSTTQVAAAPAVTSQSDAASMGSFSLMPQASDSNSSTVRGTQTRAQTQATAPVNSIATSAVAVADSITTDPNVASTTAAAESSVDSTSLETPLAENGGESSPGAGNAIFTTLRTSTATTGTEASVTAGQPTVTAIANSGNTGTTIAIVGGVVGGIAIASFLAFLLWFWRKRSHQKRRSTLLTPLSADPSFGRDEKGYVIDRGSVGPTPRTERLRADISSNFARIRGRLSSFLGRRGDTTVNLNRGHSQFMEPLPQHSRSSSRRSSRAGLRGGKLTTKDRFIDWWDRLTEDVNFNWRLRNERNSPELDPFLAARDIKEKNDALAASNQPDFLTLLGMDDSQLGREQMRRASGHGHSGSGSSGHFLGGLGLNFDGRDPFADTPRDSAKPAPLVVNNPSNPFTDANAIPSAPASTIPKPTTYVAEVRRSRGSVSAGSGPTTGGIAASGVRRSRADSYRESLQSVESFATRRNKFRSDPFDLERPELLVGRQKTSSSNTSTTRNEVRTPKMAHSRNDSFTSKYTSSTSFADWSDPGPDVGPAATRWDGGSDGRDSPTGRNVGKAM